MILREIKNMYFPALQIEYLESTGMKYLGSSRAPGTQYIDTGVLMDSTNAFIGTTLEFEVLELATDINNSALIAGALKEGYEGYNCIVYQGNMYTNNVFSFSQTEKVLNTKTTATIYKRLDGILDNKKFILFGRSVGQNNIESYGIKRLYSCKIIKNGDTIRDFIPVRIGTKGYMLDKVSGKLYGNSGTGDFLLGPDVDSGLQQIYQNKLIEGVDYDVYTYLKGTGECYIDTLINPAWNDQLSATTKVSGQPTVNYPKIINAFNNNVYIGMQIGGAWHIDNIPECTIQHRYGNDGLIAFNNFPSDSEIYMSLKVTNNAVPTYSCKINGIAWTTGRTSGSNTIAELPDTTYKIGHPNTNGIDVLKLKNVRINSHNFIPCQLLRSIPRNLDAQCKERVAGECGMIDLISGKFYGNVANLGTFTVENDTENNE